MYVANKAQNISAQILDRAEQQLINKIFKRIVIVLVFAFIIAFFNRISIGVVGANLRSDLVLNATQFGFATLLFYLFYLVFGVPSSLLLTKFKLKYYLALICIALGIISCVSIYINDAVSFYISRSAIAICEAGFLPAIFLYLSYYLPSYYRARANALLMLAMPITMFAGIICAALLLEYQYFLELRVWQLIFLIQGVGSVLFGIFLFIYLDSSIEQSLWLSVDERKTLQAMRQKDELDVVEAWGRDSQQALNLIQNSFKQILRDLYNLPIMLYTATYFCIACSLSAVNIWVIQIILDSKEVFSQFNLYLLAALTQFITILGVLFWSWHSDYKQERKFHIYLALMLGGCGWALAAIADSTFIQIIGISLASVGSFTSMSLFWTIPDQSIHKSKATAIGFINSVGNLGSGIAPWLIGYTYDHSSSYALGMYLVGALLVIGSYVILFIPINKFRPRAQI